jgi:ethanolamine ammonia-lyase small subunit
LSDDSRETLRQSAAGDPMGCDLAFVLADGLSALAIEGNAVSFLDTILPQLAHESWRVAPLVVVEQGRVAVGDEIGETLRAQMVAILIGERPGLSSPDSMGIYLTYMPRVGATDAERNCISNIRPDGMSCAEAARKLIYLMSEARSRKLSGVMLKDESVPPHQHMASERGNFLVDKGQASS